MENPPCLDDLPWFTHSNCWSSMALTNIEARLFDDRPGEEVLELGFGNGHTFPLGWHQRSTGYPGRNFSKDVGLDVTHKLEISRLGVWNIGNLILRIVNWRLGILVCLYPLSHQAGTSSLRHGNSRFCQTNYDIFLNWKWWFHGKCPMYLNLA